MNYYPYGPIQIPKDAKNRIAAKDKHALKQFWEEANALNPGLSEAVGCYIFSIRAGKGVLPWYVGLAEKQPFRKECFALHKLINYNDVIANRKGTPVLTLLPKLTAKGKFCKLNKKTGHRDIRFLENMLIGMAVRRNPNLVNVKNTKLLKEMVVPGILNTPKGRNNQIVNDFKALMGG